MRALGIGRQGVLGLRSHRLVTLGCAATAVEQGIAHGADVLKAFALLRLHGTQDHPFGVAADLGVDLAQRGERRAASQDRGIGGTLRCQQGIERGAQGVDVGAHIGAAAILFDGGIAGGEGARADNGRFVVAFIFRQPKIDEDNATIGGALDIARFNITMNNGAGATGGGVDPVVHVFQGIHHLFDPGQHQRFG